MDINFIQILHGQNSEMIWKSRGFIFIMYMIPELFGHDLGTGSNSSCITR